MKTLTRKMIAIDMDLTIVDSLTPWLKWIKQTQGREFPIGAFAGIPGYSGNRIPDWLSSYDNMGDYFRDHYKGSAPEYDVNVFNGFWEQPFLYQNLSPIEGAVQGIKRLSQGYDIVFVTHCHPEHFESKKMFLKSYFKGMDYGFIDTKDKMYVGYDVLIDDNIGVIRKGMARNPRKAHVMFNQVFADVILKPMGYQEDEITSIFREHLPGVFPNTGGWESLTAHLMSSDFE